MFRIFIDMGNKYFNIIFALFFLAICVYLVIENARKNESMYFNKVEINTFNKVSNYHEKKYLDTIVSVGLKNLKISNVKVFIYPLNSNLKGSLKDGYILKAHVRGINNFYYIWIDDMSRNEFIETIAHELIHVEQYHNRKLVYEDEGFVSWEGKKYNLNDIEYENRPWEKEAFEKEINLKHMMLLDLY